MGGVGKTELALQYAYKHYQANDYPGGVCWLRAKEGNVATQIVSFAQAHLNLTIPQGLDIQSQLGHCYHNWRDGNVLLVLDDVDNYQQIEDCNFTQDTRFKVLITTRERFSTVTSLNLDVLTPEAAFELLIFLAGKERFADGESNQLASQLCEWLGYLPLGLELVGRYMKKRRISPAEMLSRLQGKGISHKSLDEREQGMTAKRGVKAAFELSWEALKDNPEAQELAYILSLFAGAPIPWNLVVQMQPETDTEDLEDWLVILEDLHLVKCVDEAKPSYQQHQLIREFLHLKETEFTSQQWQKKFCQVMVKVARKIPDTPILKQIKAVENAIPHLAEAATTWQNYLADQYLFTAFNGLAWFYEGKSNYQEAETWYKKCLSVIHNRLGEYHISVAHSLNNLALIYDAQGRYSEAEICHLQALAMKRELLGEEHSDVADSLNNLGNVYYYQGKYEQAKTYHLQALEMRQKLLGDEHPSIAASLNNLAEVYRSQGKYTEAEIYYLQALEMKQKLLGEKHLGVANTLNNLAEVYRSQGKYTEAETYHLQALSIKKKLLGEEHPNVANSLNNLANIYKSQGKYTEAETYHLQALSIRKKLLGEEHPYVGSSLNNLANIYRKQEKYKQAENYHLQALAIRRKILGKEHPTTADSLNNLANIYKRQGKYCKAENYYVEALVIKQKNLGEEHPCTADSLNNLAGIYYSQGKYEQAEPLYLRALEIAEKRLGENHPKTVIIRNNLKKLREKL